MVYILRGKIFMDPSTPKWEFYKENFRGIWLKTVTGDRGSAMHILFSKCSLKIKVFSLGSYLLTINTVSQNTLSIILFFNSLLWEHPWPMWSSPGFITAFPQSIPLQLLALVTLWGCSHIQPEAGSSTQKWLCVCVRVCVCVLNCRNIKLN